MGLAEERTNRPGAELSRARHGRRPRQVPWEVPEAYRPGVVREKLTRGPLMSAQVIAINAAICWHARRENSMRRASLSEKVMLTA